MSHDLRISSLAEISYIERIIELDNFFSSFDDIFELLASPCSSQVSRGEEELGVTDLEKVLLE